MISRNTILTSLGLLFISCDKAKNIPEASEEKTPPPRITKSLRPPENEPHRTLEQLREAITHADAITSPEERNEALVESIWDALEMDPMLAQEGFKKLTSSSPQRTEFIKHFALRLAEQSVSQAIEWTKSLDNEQEKSLAYEHIALVLAEAEPEKAAQMLSEFGTGGRQFDVAVVQVLQRWAASSPVDAASWVSLFDESEARQAGLKAVLATWSRADPQQAMTWLGSLQNPSLQQEAMTGMAESIYELPEGKQAELLRLATPELRTHFDKLKATPEGQ